MRRIVIPRELLLTEVERWCGDHMCNARTRLSLTKAEARAYTGFECSRCERWNEDALTARDIPEWWQELKGARMSDAWKDLDESAELADAEGEGGETF